MSEKQTVELRTKDVQMLDAIINGTNWLKAAEMAGFSKPSTQASHVFTDPRALAYAYRKTRGRLTLEGAPAAFNLMLRVMNDENRDMRLRIDIAKHLFAAAGFTPPKAVEPPETEDRSDLKDMTPKDIQRFIDGVSAELQRRKLKEEPSAADSGKRQAIEDMF